MPKPESGRTGLREKGKVLVSPPAVTKHGGRGGFSHRSSFPTVLRLGVQDQGLAVLVPGAGLRAGLWNVAVFSLCPQLQSEEALGSLPPLTRALSPLWGASSP